MKKHFNFLFYLIALFLISCDKEIEKTPSYLQISAPDLITNNINQGLNTHRITDVKVFVNNKEIGIFELPITIPILQEGEVNVVLTPNVIDNFNNNSRKYFKPYQVFEKKVILNNLKVTTINPIFEYRSNAVFAFLEDFESGISFVKSGRSNTNDQLQRISTTLPDVNQPFPNSNFCGLIDIAPKDSGVIFELSNFNFLNMPNRTDVYIEADIKSNMDVQFGVYLDDGFSIVQSPVAVMFETKNQWKKIYVNLVTEIGDKKPTDKVKFFIGVIKPFGNNTINPKVYIDNVKLVYVP